jgi:hypothetical protein
MNFDRFNYQRYTGHPTYSYVDVFYAPKSQYAIPKRMLSVNFHKNHTKNIIITSNNPMISREIKQKFKCRQETQWITVAKHISDTMGMDMVVILNTYCDIKSKSQCFDVYYYTPLCIPLDTFRTLIEYTPKDDEEDHSLKP